MFGLDNRTMLARDIINILDNSDEALSAEKIQKKLGRSNVITINDVCKHLMYIASNEYGNDDYFVKIETPERGSYRLERQSTNLQSLYKAIFETDLSYLILMTVIQNREFSTHDFCGKHHVSFSTVQRKVKAINKEINPFQVHITCSYRIKFNSDELLIRSFSHLFFWSLHREISNNLFFLDYDHYIKEAEKVVAYLEKPYDPLNVRSIALWMKLFSIGIAKKQQLRMSPEKEALMQSFSIPEKPDFLPFWNENDWYALVGIMNVTGIYSFDLVFDEEKLGYFIKAEDLSPETFLECSETYFGPAGAASVVTIKRLVHRYQLLKVFIEPNTKSELRSITKHILSFTMIKKVNLLYWKNFVAFWKELKETLPISEQSSYLRYSCLMICLEAFPIDSCRPLIKVHLSSDFDVLYEGMLKQLIRSRFNQTYQIQFIEELQAADIILTTTPLNKQVLSEKQKHLTIHSQLSEKDLKKLSHLFNELILYR